MTPIKAAIIGSGNIGTDLMIKILRTGSGIEMGALVGVDPASDGLERARRLGVFTTHEGLDGLRRSPIYKDIGIVFDATSAKAHERHAEQLRQDGKRAIDLTPAAVGPYIVPVVNLEENLNAVNVNMVTCGGQATIPIVAAVARVAPVPYAEIVASIASRSAGPGTRANIDEFTETTARAIEVVGGARRGKAIIVLNPAEPPLIMRDTVYCLALTQDQDAVRRSIHDMIDRVRGYVPGYRLKQEVQFEPLRDARAVGGEEDGPALKVSVFLEVEGAGHYLPSYAGNLDIMTSAALAVAERFARTLIEENA
ncbi:acetaldehyde dehydrogenase (acetylating) [Rhizobium rhizogenes]|nr:MULTISPECIES: acetaldehyde dehydrogenase (acetylating) [Rhizobium]OCJ18941.1 acetaldehyde dehydrogenase (acetylating) [Agrobacterium sp. B131/95]EJK88094.1 acetaldehyde dehydrogenase (acetylating) [Rhizobium sp. AP16]NTI24469.1 acetaldehyde dehydrogenase (acetylating) [Rhizobium rhizogenes]NTI43789.1 acetaldehyde dehydrogenase (acetylating) [Rhizobium rhizogenes]NTI63764.1 acetaldehyde dehydrogenase (acetylating) [Rhizobium rhizogenes]